MPKAGGTTARGYGAEHQAEKDRHRKAVEAGEWDCQELICVIPEGRWIPPGTPWDLAHDRERGGYLGPAHRKCNRAEGGRWRHAKQRLEAEARHSATRWAL